MLKKKGIGSPEEFDTLLGPNSIFEGNIESEGIIRIEGKVKGDVKTNGDIFIGSAAIVTGNIYANNVSLSGTLEGNIYSKGMLKLHSSSKLYGDVFIHTFVADEGGIFQGKCNMLETPAESEANPGIFGLKKVLSGKDYKKSSVLGQINEEKEKKAD